jgi:hypothetical protein
MPKLPTDLKVLSTIYKRYYDEFKTYIKEDKTRESKIYVPIDIGKISEELKVDPDIVFGRFYYYLNNKYGYKQSNGSNVYLFAPVAGKDINAVNFPLLASVLAEIKDKDTKYRVTTGIAIAAFVISIISILLPIIFHY